MDRGDRASKPIAPVGDEKRRTLWIAPGAELLEGRFEGLGAQHERLIFVEYAEARVEPGEKRVRAKQPVAEPVDGGDPGSVELARKIGAPSFEQALPNPHPELARGALGVGDDKQ